MSGGRLLLAMFLFAAADPAASRPVLDGGIRAEGLDAILAQDSGAEVRQRFSLEASFDYMLGVGDPATHEANIGVLWGKPSH